MRILLQDYMFDSDLSVRQVAIATGVPRSTISDICNGVMPRMDTMELLAKSLRCRISDLYESPYNKCPSPRTIA